MKKLFIASKNKGKIKEIKQVLDGTGVEIISPFEINNIPDVEETGSTFRENALIKARAIHSVVKIPVLADDSGLEVNILNGAPGVYSARYAGENASDFLNNRKLLDELSGITDRRARFKCVLVLYEGGAAEYFEGTCEGNILTEPYGEGGFGYDPLFQPLGFDKTFAGLDAETKNKISHRGKALQKLKEFLRGKA